jgi:hypothetical protein
MLELHERMVVIVRIGAACLCGVLDSAVEGQVGAATRIGHAGVLHHRYRNARLPF